MKVLLLTLLAAGVPVTQTPDNLRKRYGPPVSQTFVVRPGVTATVTSAESGDVCEILVEPQRRLVMKSSTPKLTLKQINEVIDELVPPGVRGEPGVAGFVNARCLPDDDCWGTSADYERIHIYYNAAGKDAYRFATVKWKLPACRR
jgi:hypothetical protein